MIDLMEVGRQLWESGDAQHGNRSNQARPALDLMELGRQLWDDEMAESSSATVRNSSATAQPDDSGLSASPQNPQAARIGAENTRHPQLSATHPQTTAPLTAGLSANPQYPQHPAPVREIEAIISSLTDAGHDVDARLAHRLRETMAPLSRRYRADLALAVDDAMTATSDPDKASRRAMALLGDATARGSWNGTSSRGPIGDRMQWIDWIADRCALLTEDRTFICRRMRTLPPRAAERTARRYVATWHAAAEAEASPVKQDNAGRAAANRSLLALVR
ncbi:MAG: hypothetical protein VX796_12960 [Pseudomonadota bacterium]|nr:hypothetical protein [Pseudomonadota bacterium]